MADSSDPPSGAALQNGDSHNKAQQTASESPQSPKPAAEPDGAPALTPAQLKKQKQAEKAARRAKEKAEKDAAGGGGARPSGPTGPTASAGKKGDGQKEGKQPQKDHRAGTSQGGQQGRGQQRHQEPGSVMLQKNMPMRSRPSTTSIAKETRKEKEVGLFGHLYGQPRRHTIEGAAKEVHPAVLALGLQMSSYVVCGSTARCVAMLLAFKSVIESYSTPPGTSLARHLTSHHLSPQIDYLKSCRPISISMGNSIRWLKDLIVKIDPAVGEAEAKRHIIASIDSFIRERVTAPATLISQTASARIQPGDVILTYASSSVVQKTLLTAHDAGTPFRVIVVDSKPLFEGKTLARRLAAHGLNVQYTLISAAAHAVKDATKVLLGAHAMMSNGRLYSRVGTALVAMLAHERDIPVIVCCESIKFTEKVALDSVVGNEVAPAEELLSDAERDALLPLLGAGAKVLSSSTKEDAKDEKKLVAGKGGEEVLARWRDSPNLQMLNVLYDVTPAEYIKMVVTEFGSLPPSSVPVVHRMSQIQV